MASMSEAPTQGLLRLIYVSTSMTPFTDAELMDLLTLSRGRNHAVGVTGMLLYNDGNWMQVLEGPHGAVRETYSRIRIDPRHQDVTKVVEDDVSERSFDQWSMGFRNLSLADANAIPGFSDFMNRGLDRRGFRPDPSGCMELLTMFRDG
jgi:hypothetical protein